MTKSLAVILALMILLGLQSVSQAQSQLPDMVRGYQFASETKVPSIVADDFIYSGNPMAAIRWWGGFWTPVTAGNYSHYADGRPSVLSTVGISAWYLKFYQNIPASGPGTYAQPGALVASGTFTTGVSETYYEATTTTGRHVYSYYADLSQAIWSGQPPLLTAGTAYWLSIEADMSPTSDSVQWGWQESDFHAGSAAVQNFRGAGWVQIQNNMYDNDMAFQIVPIPEPAGLSALGIGLSGLATMFFRRRR